MLIIPALDIQQGQCVRLRKGQFAEPSIYDFSPFNLAESYVKAGAKHLHIVDLDGAKSGRLQQLALIQSLRKAGASLQVGGGIRSLESAKLCLNAQIESLVIGSIALTNPKLTEDLIQLAGVERIILALDVHVENQIPKLAIHGWQKKTSISLWELLTTYQQKGLRQILCTDIDCDGMMAGPNFNLYEEALNRFPNMNWQASGGIRDLRDLAKLAKLGLSAAILGRMLYESDFDLSSYLAEQKNGS